MYESKWNGLLLAAKDLKVKAANPLLIKVSQEYVEADIKVMIVGQETDGWAGQLNAGSQTVDDMMGYYYEYLYENSDPKREDRPFWNRKNYRYFMENLQKHFKPQNKSVSCIWNNISKIGKNGRGMPQKSIITMERAYFNVVKAEIEILKPDIIIFSTGDSRDDFIKHHFGPGVEFKSKLSLDDNTFEKETLNLLAEVALPDFEGIASIRIEHPNRRSLSNFISVSVLKSVFENKNDR